jgi:hypothetical protein
MSTGQELMVRNGWDVAFIPELQAWIDAAVCSASLITRVDTEQLNEAQVKSVARLDTLIRGIESARKAHKEPFLEAGRKIDSIAKDASAPLLEEKARLIKLASDHRIKIQEEARILEAEKQRKIQEEERRIREEQLAADRERWRIEQAKQAEIDAANKAAAEAKTKVAREKAAAEAERLRQAEAERLKRVDAEAEAQRQAAQAQLANIVAMPVPEPPQAEGQRFRDYWDWKDLNLYILCKTYGDRFVKLEVKRQELKDFINGPDCPRKKDGTPDLPGTFYRDSKQTVRAPAARKAIDV